MANKLKKLYYSFRYYGLSYVLLRISDKISGNEKAAVFLYDRHMQLDSAQYEEEIVKLYAVRKGKKLDIKNPHTFNEKIQWIKLHDMTELKTTLADKYLVRDWVKEKIGEKYLIPLLGVWNTFEEIKWDDLPESFILKTNHGSGCNIVVQNKNDADIPMIRSKMNDWLSMNFAFTNAFEMQYHDIPPKIIAEKYMERKDGNLYDYKIYCFHGKPEYIQIIGDRDLNAHTAREAFYDTGWVLQPFITYTYPQYKGKKAKPAKLEEMLKIAGILSEGFIYVRVDLYELDNGDIKFGEMTFTPASGFACWNPPEADGILGEKIHLPYRV